jgi:hypothetical protein
MKKHILFISFNLAVTLFLGCEKDKTTTNYDWIPTSNKSLLLDSSMLEGNTRAYFYTIDNSNGYLSIYNKMISPPKYSLYRISDKGRDFEKINYPVGRLIKDLSFINSFSVYLLLEDTTAQPDIDSELYYSEDGGISWTEKNNHINNNIKSTFAQIHFSSIDSGIAISGTSKDLFYTTDGGENWIKNENRLFLNDKYIRNFTTIHNEPNICFLTLGDSLIYSIDGGFIWQIHSYIGDRGYYLISFINKNVGYIANEYDIYKINNIGSDVTKVYTSERSINQIEAINDHEIYFSANYSMFKTSDNFHSVKIMNIKDPYPNEDGDRIIINFTLLLGNGLLVDTKGTIYCRN